MTCTALGKSEIRSPMKLHIWYVLNLWFNLSLGTRLLHFLSSELYIYLEQELQSFVLWEKWSQDGGHWRQSIALTVVNSFYTIPPQLIPVFFNGPYRLPSYQFIKPYSVILYIDVKIRNFGTLLAKMAEIGRQFRMIPKLAQVPPELGPGDEDGSSSHSRYIWSSLDKDPLRVWERVCCIVYLTFRYLAQLQYYRAGNSAKPTAPVEATCEETKRRASVLTGKNDRRGNRRSSVFERVSKGVFEDLRVEQRSESLQEPPRELEDPGNSPLYPSRRNTIAD